MSYSGRTRYKTMREKNDLVKKRTKAVLIALFVAVLALILINRVAIKDYLITFFY